MRVVGLISGGKDSIWNLHYCREFGHEITCLANLAPPAGVDEMDSYMYQTVGWDLVDNIALALELPLIRRVITGAPKSTSSQTYAAEEGDEVEDLTLLLQDVLQAHPDVQAVSCGAILSNYQRLRVEDVCSRLGLKVLAFMWRQEQDLLLRQMIEGNVDARIVKVASMGLQGKHVGKSILDPAFAHYIGELGRKWGVHVCGEGGEYETAVLDAPLYNRSLSLQQSEVVAHEDGGDVSFLRVAEVGTCVKETGASSPPYEALAAYNSLRYYEETFPQVSGGSSAGSSSAGYQQASVNNFTPQLLVGDCAEADPSRRQAPVLRTVGDLMISSSLDVSVFGLQSDGDPSQECDTLLNRVDQWLLEQVGWGPAGTLGIRLAVFCEVQVRDLSCFDAVNAVYARHFRAQPPARVCIQTPLPDGLHLRIRLTLRPPHSAIIGSSGGDGSSQTLQAEDLRVQSISTWAMACIGPYSQAWRVGPLLLTAGVIGLVPHSMVLPKIAQVAEAGGACSSAAQMQQWEPELWMLMRSMNNVLSVMQSSFEKVCLAQVYVAGDDCNHTDVIARVLAYMQQESACGSPLITCTKLPRLPKDGSIEINLTCVEGTVAAIPPVSTPCSVNAALAFGGHVASTCCSGDGVKACSTEVIFDESAQGDQIVLSLDALQYVVGECLASLDSSLGFSAEVAAARPKGFSLQIQYVLAGEHVQDCLASAIRDALCSRGLGDSCATSFMPVLSLGPRACIRMTAVAS